MSDLDDLTDADRLVRMAVEATRERVAFLLAGLVVQSVNFREALS